MNCPKCGAKCGMVDFTTKMVYIFCKVCAFQTWENKQWVNREIKYEF